ncbi:hypothetical protein ACVILL_002310 [Bradyrhizobium sp. USDA 3364]
MTAILNIGGPLRRGRRAGRGAHLGDEPGRRRPQHDRLGIALGGLLRRRGQPRQFLVLGHGVTLADQHVDDLGAVLIDIHLRLAARHDEAGDADHVGEAGIGRFGHYDQRLARRLLLLRMGAVVEGVIGDSQREENHGAERRLEVLGKVHRLINPELGAYRQGLSWALVEVSSRPPSYSLSMRKAGVHCSGSSPDVM